MRWSCLEFTMTHQRCGTVISFAGHQCRRKRHIPDLRHWSLGGDEGEGPHPLEQTASPEYISSEQQGCVQAYGSGVTVVGRQSTRVKW